MSSFVGHIAAGTALYLARPRLDDRPARWTLPVLVAVAAARRTLTRHPAVWGLGMPAWGACLAWSLAIH